MSYQIQISEAQRLLLVAVLTACPAIVAEHVARYPSTEFEHDNCFHLLGCFSDMPEHVDPAQPNMLHGFSL